VRKQAKKEDNATSLQSLPINWRRDSLIRPFSFFQREEGDMNSENGNISKKREF